MESTDSSRKASDSGSNGEAQGDGATTTRRKLNDQQEREVTRLYAETETPVSEISKRFGIGESSVYRVAQRHGAALRGRSSPTAGSSSTRGAAATAAASPAATAPTGRGRGGRGRGRAAASSSSTAGRSAATSPTSSAASTPSGNGRRTRGTRARQAAAAAPATPARGRGGATGRRASSTRAARTTGGRSTGRTGRAAATRGGTTASSSSRVSFRVSYVAMRVFQAVDMNDAIRQATAAGATDITSISRG